MDYSNFSVEDFAADDYFIRWVSQNDQEAEKFWTLFISLHPEAKPKIDQARMMVLHLAHKTDQIAETDHSVEVIWEGIQERIEHANASRGWKTLRSKPVLAIAASLAAIALFAAGFYLSDQGGSMLPDDLTGYTSISKDFVEKVNLTGKPLRIRLSDGTMVHLGENSRLVYKDDYAGDTSRHVYLTGEAFFDVTKNPKQPFFVHAKEVVAKVLGTSFNVTAYDDEKNIIVSVMSGKVSVFSPKNDPAPNNVQAEVNGVILLPNQQVVYQRELQSFEKTLVDEPVVLSNAITSNNFNFENAPIPDVFRTLEESYGIEIIFDEEVMKTCFITAPLGSESLFEKLRIICRTIGATYEVIESKIVINSAGCL